MSAKNIFEVIKEKQEQYNDLEKELQILIRNAEGVDVRYKGKEGILIRIFTNNTADILLENDEGQEYEQHVKLSDLY